MRMRSLVVLALLASLSGCNTMRFEVSNEPHGEVVYDRKSFFFWGLTPTKEIDVSDFCSDGVAAIREETGLSDTVFSVLTLGFWQPRSSWYYCRRGEAQP